MKRIQGTGDFQIALSPCYYQVSIFSDYEIFLVIFIRRFKKSL